MGMKVMWFTNVPLAGLVRSWGESVGGTGFWMNSLIKPLMELDQIDELHVVWAGNCKGRKPEQVVDGVHYYCVHISRYAEVYGVRKKAAQNKSLDECEKLIACIQPDVIHIHGSERHYGRLKSERRTDVPTMLSIQGLLSPYAQYAFGDKSFLHLLQYQRCWDIVRGFPTMKTRRRFEAGAKEEAKFLQSMDAIAGRTHWDRAHARAMAPDMKYYHVDEMMRPEFFQAKWSPSECQPLRLYTTARLTLLKGMHTLLKAVALVKRSYPDVTLCVGASNPKSAETRYMEKMINALGLADNIILLGWLDSAQIVQELKDANLFICPSFIENSSNAVCEAMLVGTPVLATDVGGMGTLIRQNVDGMLVRAGDAAVMACAIENMLEDMDYCLRLSESSRVVAHKRHNPEAIVTDLVRCYSSLIEAK